MLSDKCEICYQDIKEDESRKFCNNCGNDFHEKCIGQVTDNKCPNCREQFSITKPQSRTFTITASNEKEEGGIPWWAPFIIFEVLNIMITFSIADSSMSFLQILGIFLLLSVIFLLISPLAAWRWRSYGL